MSESNKSLHLLNSGQLDEIIGQPPNWLIRWGTIIFLVIFGITTALSLIIRYPVTINVPFYTKKIGDSSYVILKIIPSDLPRIKIGQSIKLQFRSKNIPIFSSQILNLEPIENRFQDSALSVRVYLSKIPWAEINNMPFSNVEETGTAEILVENYRLSDKILRNSFIKQDRK